MLLSATSLIEKLAVMTPKDNDIKITYFKSSGPGGQKKNVTESAVRVCHTPTGMIVVATSSRSQRRNREDALNELHRRIRLKRQRKRRRVATNPTRASKQRRLDMKKRRKSIKKLRGRPEMD